MITTIRTTGRELTDEYLGCDIKVFEGARNPIIYTGTLVRQTRAGDQIGPEHSTRYGILQDEATRPDVIGLAEDVWIEIEEG